MTTVADIVNDAALAAGIGDIYNPMDATQAALCLRTLNRMLESWSTESLSVYTQSQASFAMTPGQAAYSTALLPERPVQITHVFVRQSGVDYQCDLIGAEDYAEISFKETSGLPDRCYFNAGMPSGTFTFFPVPSTPYDAYIGYLATLTAASSLQQVVSFPPGYEMAIVYGLASAICPAFGREPTPTCIYHAKSSKSNIRTINYSLDEERVGVPIGEGLFNIYRGS